jgi:uncharacterized protein (DUF849 family)
MDDLVINIISFVSAILAGLAALFWAKSSAVDTPHQSKGSVSIGAMADSLKLQSKWSAWGAVMAALAAVAQAVALGYPALKHIYFYITAANS